MKSKIFQNGPEMTRSRGDETTKFYLTAIACSVIALLCSFVLASRVLASEEVPAKKTFNPVTALVIELTPHIAAESEEPNKTKLKRGCHAFAKKLTRGLGPLGVGPFVKVSCEFENPTSKDSLTQTKTKPQWALRFSTIEAENKTRAELYFSEEKKAMVVVDLDTIAPISMLLQNNKITDLLAVYISEGMPFRSVLSTRRTRKELKVAVHQVSWLTTKNCVVPAEEFYIYSLELLDSTWRPTVVGSAKKSEEANQSKGVYKVEFEEASEEVLKRSKSTVLFAHNKSAGKVNKPLLASCIAREVRKTNEKWYTIISSARVGLRIGISALPNTVVKRRIPSFGMFGEFRSGMLDGLKIQYDQAGLPGSSDLKSESELGTDEFQFSRLALGVSFYRLFDGSIVSALDVTPRLGVTNLMILHVEPAESEDPGYEFKLSRAATLGIEFGAERRHMLGLWRAWSYLTYSIPGLSLDKKYSTKAARFGLDTYIKLFDMGSLSLDGVAFGVYDYTVVSANSASNDAATLAEFVLTNAYIGAGVAVSW